MREIHKIEKEPLRADAVTALRRSILRGEFAAGERLVEARLAEEMGISRNPLREALRELEQEGLVVNVSRKGTFAATFSGEDVCEIYALREALEGLAVRLAIERIKPDDITKLEAILGEMRTAAARADFCEAMEWDMAFHREICRASGNRRLLHLWNGLAAQIQLVVSRVRETHFTPAYIVETHVPLLEAIRKRDVEEAELQLRHILGVGRSVAQQVDERS
jgi:DNA-binding GntR family transcriptional regulator